MRIKTLHSGCGAIALLLLLGACATPSGKEAELATQQRIAEAERVGNLEALFDRLALEAGRKGMFVDNKEAQAAMEQAGGRLARLRLEEVRQGLERVRLVDGEVPLDSLNQAAGVAQRMQRWDAARQQELLAVLASERARTQSSLDRVNDQLRALGGDDVSARYRLLGQAAALAGPESAQGLAFLSARERLLREAYEDGVRALESDNPALAEARFAAIGESSPGYRDVERRLGQAQASRFAQMAASRRDAASIDQAMALYASLRERPDYSELRPRLTRPATELQQFMIAKGGTATAEDKLNEAYAWLSRARAMRELLGGGTQPSPEERRFAELTYNLAEAAGKRGQPGLALGYLLVAQDAHPEFPGLRRALRDMQERTLDRATKKITAASFTGNGESARLGGTVASKVTQKLFQALPNDIRIVERDQLQAVLREQEIVAMQGASAVSLASADYLMQGAVLEAMVESSEQRGRKTMRVMTGKQQVPNPAYTEWSKGGREDRPPPESLERPQYEDIPLGVSVHRKVGVLGVSYRIVDASNARVVFTDTLTRRRTESGESADGIQLGEFTAPMKIAELPSDSEILEGLADEVASHIAAQMVAFLRDPELNYLAAAERHRAEDHPAAAAEMLAYAWSLTQKKGKPGVDLGTQLRATALRARPAS
jgi:curli biogenesis system outer membrane secretion channel CsgG